MFKIVTQRITRKFFAVGLIVFFTFGLIIETIKKEQVFDSSNFISIIDHKFEGGGNTEQSNLPTNKIVNQTASEVADPQAVSTSAGTLKSDEQTKAKVLENYGQLPLHFELNNGQISSDQVRFTSRGQGYNLFLSPTKATLALRQSVAQNKKDKKNSQRFKEIGSKQLSERVESDKAEFKRAVVEMQIIGGNPQAQSIGAEELQGKSNYFIGNDPSKWQTDVANYKRVRFEEVYSGINLEYYGNQRQLEYDFIVEPNADPEQIRLKFKGVRKVKIDKQSGELVLKTSIGEVRQKKPFVYQTDEKTGERVEVASSFKVKGKEVSFELAEYDQTKQLTIDPVVLVYSTFLGGSGFDLGYAIEVDNDGNTFVVGYTESIDFPRTTTRTYAGGQFDAFISKLNAAGNALIYSSYLGGSGNEHIFGPLALDVDSSGNAYVGGTTNSKDFPTTMGAFQEQPGAPSNSGDLDAFISKFNSTGSQLVYSSYLGGNNVDWLREIKVDGAGNAYIGGHGRSLGLSTTGVLQSTITSNCDFCDDIYIAKINPAGNQKIYFTYLGGPGVDYGYGLAIDNSGNAYVTGETCDPAGLTNSPNFPTTPGVVQTTFYGGGGGCDAFLSKINENATTLVYSTYHGGSGYDYGWDIEVDSQNNAYIVGGTSENVIPNGVNFPTTPGAFQTAYAGGAYDAYVTKFNSTATERVYSTLIGGNGYDVANDLAVDNAGNVYVAGDTNSPNFPLVQARQQSFGGASDGFVLKLNNSGKPLYSTYHGGENIERAHGIAVDNAGNAYVTGVTRSTSFPITNSYQPVIGGNYDAFVTKLKDPPLQTYSISGKVVSNGIGVAGVTIVLNGAITTQTITDATGFYQFPNLSSGGNYHIFPIFRGGTFTPESLFFPNLNSNQINANFSAFACTFSINGPTEANFQATGGTGNFNVVSNCQVIASSNVPWIIVTSNSVSYVVQQNYGPARSGSISINGASYTVTQAAGQTAFNRSQNGGEPCPISFTSESSNQALRIVPHTGENNAPITGLFTVNTETNCDWTVVSNKPWINVPSDVTHTGSKTINFTVNPYGGNIPRASEVAVNGRLFTIVQTPKFPQEWGLNISPTSGSVFSATGGDGSFGVSINRLGRWATCVPNPKTPLATCVPPSSPDSWIELPESPGNSGSEEDKIARFRIKPNQGPAQRTGIIVIGDKFYTIIQEGTGSQMNCSFRLFSNSLTLPSGTNETGSFNLSVGAGCTWQATSSDPSWLEIMGGSGNGDGTVSFKAKTANSGSTPRSANIMVGGQTFTVTQNGSQQQCSYTIDPDFRNISEESTAGIVTITAPQGCAWSASSDSGWLSINSGQTGSGNGQLSYVAQPNTMGTRQGKITVAGQTFTVNQSAGTAQQGGNISPVINSLNPQTVFRGGADFELTVNGTNFVQNSVVRWDGEDRATVFVSPVQLKAQISASDLQTAGQIPVTVFNATSNLLSLEVKLEISVPSRKAFDFDGDGKADIAVFRPENGTWYLLNSQSGFTASQFGISTDRITPADYDGDGKTDVAVYRGGIWYLLQSTNGFAGISFGIAEDIPVPADYDGDGKSDIAVFRPSNGTWYLLQSAAGFAGIRFGITTDKPVAGDYDGDGKADIAVYRDGNWYQLRSQLGFNAVQFGISTDKPVVGDYDGDGRADIAVYRPENGAWYLLQSTAGFAGIQFGISTDIPAPADFDGDGKTDLAVYRNGIWYLLQSTSGFTGIQFGVTTDKPASAAFVP